MPNSKQTDQEAQLEAPGAQFATPPPALATEGEFRGDIAAVLPRLCRAFGRVIECLPGPVRRAADVQRVLGVDKALGWQVFRLASAADPMEAGPFVPRPAPLAKALAAACRCGVPASALTEAAEASAEFERLLDRHAGDRVSFEAMLRGLQADESQHAHLKDRRAAFRADSTIWGRKAQASYSCIAYHAGEKPDTQDSVLVAGHIALQKLRRDVSISVGYRWGVHQSTDAGVGASIPAPPGADFVDGFSTHPLPRLTTRELKPGVMETAFELDGVGRSGAVTYLVRHIARAASDSSAPWYGGNSICRVPVEVAIHDLLIPRGWSDPTTASVTTYGNLRDTGRAIDRDPADRLPVDGSMLFLGQSLDRLQTPLAPRCPEMITHVLRGMGWDRTVFDIFRSVVQYPVLHAGIATRVDAARPARQA